MAVLIASAQMRKWSKICSQFDELHQLAHLTITHIIPKLRRARTRPHSFETLLHDAVAALQLWVCVVNTTMQVHRCLSLDA